jgi:type I restriction enzyme S subunit
MYDGEALLLGRKGTIDKPMYFNGSFWAVDTMFYAIAKKDVNTKYIYYCANSFPFIKISTATALPSMTQTDLYQLPVMLPPLSEQQAIAAYLDEKCTKIDAATENIGKQIDALKRLKRALINEVVTGQRAV